MPFNPYPGGGSPDWEGFTGRIEARFGQQMKRPVWLSPFATADLPTLAGQGANEGALAYDDTLNAPTFYNGSAWKAVGVVGSGAALTRTNDTNVTITLGGAPTTALLSATSLTVGWTGQLAADRGGTGIASYAVGDLIYASGATTLSKLADVATGNALISGGVTTAPSWGKIGLTTHVSGTLGPGNGGTGITSLGTGVATALGVNVGSAGAFVTFNGALGTPSSGTLTNCTGLPNAGVVGLGTAATVNTGTSGATIPLLNGANTWSAGQTFSASITASKDVNAAGGFRTTGIDSTGWAGAGGEFYLFGSDVYLNAYNRTSGANIPMHITFSTLAMAANGTDILAVSGTGIDVTGEARCDSLRIDASPSVSAAGTSHKLAVNLNGTTYYILLSNV